jgi:hypothetical protein
MVRLISRKLKDFSKLTTYGGFGKLHWLAAIARASPHDTSIPEAASVAAQIFSLAILFLPLQRAFAKF